MTTKQRIQAFAYNPVSRKIERVFIEDEVPEEDLIYMCWSETLRKYVTVPE